MKRHFNKDYMYPLPQRTVLYSRKKHMKPVPEVGKKYHCFDDGKIRFNHEDFCEWLVEEGDNVRKGVDEDIRRECICYGIYFHLPSDLKERMSCASGRQDEPIANIMISVIKEMGVYKCIK